jgi:hypothetical protein
MGHPKHPVADSQEGVSGSQKDYEGQWRRHRMSGQGYVRQSGVMTHPSPALAAPHHQEPVLTNTDWEPVVFPAHALLIVEERLREQEAEGVRVRNSAYPDSPAWRTGRCADPRLVPQLCEA